MKAANAVAEILKQRRRRVPHRLPGQPDHRGRRRGGHPHDHRPPGADRPAHGRRGQPHHLRRAHRRLRHAARARHRERLRRRRPGLSATRCRSSSCPAATRAQLLNITPELQLAPELPARHQVVRAGHPAGVGAATPCAAPSPRCKNGRPRPVLVEIPVDVMRDEVPGRLRLHAGAAPAHGARPAGRDRAGRRPGRRRAAGDLRRPGRPLRAGLAAAARAGRAAGGAGHDQPAGQERLPREPSALARLRRALDPQAAAPLPEQRRRHLRHRLQLRRRPATAWPCRKGKTIIHATLDPLDINKDVVADHGAGRRRRADARRADRRGEGPAQGQAARPRWRAVTERDRQLQAASGSRSGCRELTSEDHAALALPRDLGSAAHGRRRQHDHHPRRRQPARPDLAVLGADRAAHLHRLGQDHPARLRPRPGDGRQAGPARQALHQRLGRRRHRLHRHGLRDRRARAHPDPVDLCSTTSRWRSSCRS